MSEQVTERAPNGKLLYRKGKSGNKAGRPLGAKTKITSLFFDDLYTKWKKRGAKAIDRMIDERPGDFVRVVASLMPRELKITSPMAELSDEEIYDILTQLRRAAGRETQSIREGIDTGDFETGENKQIECVISEGRNIESGELS
jgi:hypothetical protein